MSNSPEQLLGMHFDDVVSDPLVLALKTPPKLKKIDRNWYLVMQNAGISLSANLDKKADTVFLYSAGKSGFKEYKGILPAGIMFSDSRHLVRKKLGKPVKFGGGDFITGLGKMPKWDAFDFDTHRLHVEYTEEDNSIVQVTLMTHEAVPT